MTDKSQDKVSAFYEGLRRHPPYSVERVGWKSKESQELRFKQLIESCELEGSTVVDVGCGVGDFYHYLCVHHSNCQYIGVDQSEEMIRLARQAYPSGIFVHRDLGMLDTDFVSECIVASGTFNLRVDNSQLDYIETAITKMVNLATKTVVITLLQATPSHMPPVSSPFYYYNKEEIAAILEKKGYNYGLKTDYSSYDMTIKISK